MNIYCHPAMMGLRGPLTQRELGPTERDELIPETEHDFLVPNHRPDLVDTSLDDHALRALDLP